MSTGLIGVVTLIYLATCVSLWLEGQKGMSLCFLGYSVANVGMIWALQTSLKPY